MQITINSQVLCHGHERVLGQAQGPIGEFGMDSAWPVQPRRGIRASGTRPVNRGNESGTIAFTVEVEHATRAAAETWLKTHKAALVLQGTLTLAGDTHSLVYEDASLTAFGARLAGVTVRLTYTFTVGEEGTTP
jgi:hypothetical protein